MFTVDRETFEGWVEEAWLLIPRKLRRRVENVSIEVEEDASAELGRRDRGTLLGLYTGVPLTERSTMWAHGPDRIILFQRNIESICRSEEELKQQIRDTLWHELGHYFGMDEHRLRREGY